MGVKILGVGIDKIIIEGVEILNGCDYCVLLDCIEIGIFFVVVVVIGGKICCIYVVLDIFDVVLDKFE